MRRVAVLALLAVTGLAIAPASADPSRSPVGGRRHGTYAAAGLPALKYALYVPAAVAARPARPVPLYVYLHGCNQTADDAAVGTRLEQLADDKDLLVLFPQQTRPAVGTYPLADGNGSGCWNWFLPDHQTRGRGEPAAIAGLTHDVMRRFAVDRRRVWLAGISAGADMTTILGATYPDLYAAISPIAGCAYLDCADVTGTAAVGAMGAYRRAVPTLVVQGSADAVNNPAMGATAVQQWVNTDSLADGSVPRQPTSVVNHDAVRGTPPGDPCAGHSRLPCLGGALGLRSYPYTVVRYDDPAGRSVVEVLVIHGAGHAYTGGNPQGSFVDPVGPDLSRATYAFFAEHPFR